jgi:ankyrin repeat protein
VLRTYAWALITLGGFFRSFFNLQVQSGKVDMAVFDPEGRPALHRAIDYKSPGIIDAILKSKGAVNARNAAGDTALHVAVARNDLDVLVRLLKVGADASAVSSGSGHTPLTQAIKVRVLYGAF